MAMHNCNYKFEFDKNLIRKMLIMHKSSRIFYVKLLLQNRFQPIIRHIIELLPIGKFELTKAFRLSAQAWANRGHYIDPPTPYFLCQMSDHLCWIIPCKWCAIKITFDKKILVQIDFDVHVLTSGALSTSFIRSISCFKVIITLLW